jgi:CO/xanthine dehydrogenase FAD-binding subunit
MKPPPFAYVCATTLDEALAVLAEYGDECKVLAGGQSLVPLMNLRMVQPARLVDINRLTALDYVRVEGQHLAIGALTRHSTLADSSLIAEHCPLMSAAYGLVGHLPVRNRGTLGGNLSHAYPASEMPAVALAVDATLVVRSSKGQREIAADDFFVGALETALVPEELVTEIRIPVRPAGQGWSFQEVSPRKGDFALVGAGATIQVKDGLCAAVRLVYCGVGDRPERIPEAEQVLLGKPPDETLFREAGEIASRKVDPLSDFHADETYRRDLVRVLTRRTLIEAHGRCA